MGNEKNNPPADSPNVVPAEAAPSEKPALSVLQRANAGEQLEPSELAVATGNTFALRPNITFDGTQPAFAFSAKHSAADQLHGWSHHSLHDAKPFKLTLDAYTAALKATDEHDEKGKLHPVSAACSKYAPYKRIAAARDEAAAQAKKAGQ